MNFCESEREREKRERLETEREREKERKKERERRERDRGERDKNEKGREESTSVLVGKDGRPILQSKVQNSSPHASQAQVDGTANCIRNLTQFITTEQSLCHCVASLLARQIW